MSDENKVSRRTALKVIGIGVGTASTLPVFDNNALGQHMHPGMEKRQSPGVAAQGAGALRFFNAQEMAMVATISDLIIPSDERSPGAKEAEVPAFIDLMVSESPNEIRLLWRDGLAAVERMSQQKFKTAFNSATSKQQISLLRQISKNEFLPKTLEERFFRAIKNLTIDGYYTSPIGIHQELQYKGNAYLKDFIGCTYAEDKS